MLSSLMPGFRELRTPLSAGYLWLINVWLLFGAPLPKQRPAAGVMASAWTLADYVGKPGIAAALSFAAYLVGTFVEINPLHLWEHGGRPRWVTRIRNLARLNPILKRFVVLPVSAQAERDLLLFSRDDLGIASRPPDEGPSLMRQIMYEERQIATRLQANNTELFGKYDRLLAESSFRINISLPLVVLATLASLSLPIHGPWRAVPPILGMAYSVMLFRQGVQRAIQSRDVMLQALIVGVVESRAIGRLRGDSSESDGEASADIDDLSLRRGAAVGALVVAADRDVRPTQSGS